MNNKLLFSILLLSIVLSSVSYADISSGLTHRYPLTTDGTDAVGSIDLTNHGVTFESGYATFVKTESDYLTSTENHLIPAGTGDFSFCMQLSATSKDYGCTLYNGDSFSALFWKSTGDATNYKPEFHSSVGTVYDYTLNLNLDTFYDVCYVRSSGTLTIYVDGDSKVSASVGNLISSTKDVRIGATEVTYFNGKLAEVCIWDRALDSTDLSDYSSQGCAATPQPSLTLNTNLVNNTINYNSQTLNFNVNGTFANHNTDLVNISFYQQGVLNQTIEHNLSTNLYYNITLPSLYEGFYTINFNASNYETNASSGVYSYKVDLLQPYIVTDLTNNSIYFKNVNLLDFYFESSDNNLYAMNFTIFELNPNGSINNTKNNTFITGIATTSNNITYINNLTNYNLSKYRVDLTAWDSHTAKEIKNYQTKKLSDGYEFNNDIKITSKELKKMDITKLKDRYSFDMEFTKENPEIVLECEDLRYLPNSEYTGHLICWATKKWVDFEDLNGGTVKVEVLGKNKVKVIPQTTGKTSFKFNSIGDLNENSRSYFFNVTEGFYVYAYDIETNTTITEFNAIAVGSLTLEESTTTGVVFFNQISGVFNLSLSSMGYINYSINNITFTPAGTYSAYMNLSNAFRVYIRNQLDNILINDRSVWLEFIGTNSSNYSTTTGTKFITNLNPDNYIIRYSALDYSNAFYYFTLQNGTNTQFTIYMLPSTNTDNVTATVIDEVSKTVSNAYIHVQRYDLNTNTYRTVEILQTNFEGRTVLHVTKNTEFYKFLVYYNDKLELETDPTYIYEDTVTLQIQTTENVANNFYTTEGINWDLTYNPTTLNFNFDYSDASNTITSGTLLVYNTSYGGQTLYNSGSSSSPSATILVSALNISGNTYLAKAYVMIDGENILLGEMYYNYPATIPPDDNSKLFWVIMLTILFATLGFWDLTISIILTPIPIIIASAIKFIPLPIYATIPLEIIAIILVIIINNNRG